jgi:RNA polymerase sigma factor (sigma-70 family)
LRTVYAIDQLRKDSRWREEALIIGEEESERALARIERLPASGTIDPESAFSQDESQRIVRDALAQLPDKYRLPIVYAAIDGLDYPAIAEMLGVPLGTVQTLVFRGKRMLKERIEETMRPGRTGDTYNAL